MSGLAARPPGSLSVEDELASRLSGTAERRGADRDAIEGLGRSVDPDRLLAILERQHVVALLGTRLEEALPGEVPEPFRAVVAEHVAHNRRRGALFAHLTNRLCGALGEAGIESVALKGVGLAERAHGDIGLRSSQSDIDLLTSPGSLQEAVRVLLARGCRVLDNVDWGNDLPHYHSRLVIEQPVEARVELHWRLHWYEGRFAQEMLGRSTPDGDGVMSLLPVDELVSLLLIFARDGFPGLRIPADIAAWWDRHGSSLPDAPLDLVIDSHPRLRTPLLTAVDVLEREVGVPAHRLVDPAMKRSKRTQLACRLAGWNASGDEESATNVTLNDLLLTPRGAYRTYLRHYFWQPIDHYRQVYGWPPEQVVRNQVRRAIHAAGRLARTAMRYSRQLWRLRGGVTGTPVPAKLVVLIDGQIEGAMRGPEIRAWELARAMADRFDVTVLADTDVESVRDGVRVVPSSRLRVLAETLRNDAILAPWPPPYALLAAALRRRVCVADLYDPIDRELVTVPGQRHFVDELRAVQRLTRMHLRFANVLVFASESQRDALLDRAEGVAGEQGASGCDPRVAIVPMGIRGTVPGTTMRPIREAFPAIGGDDRIVLWWGSLWRWLDPETAIRAVRLLADRGERVKLVFTAGSAGDDVDQLAAVEEARALAANLALLDRDVFFLDRWVPYEDRHRWLADADVGISLHRSDAEGELAARARYMDFLWARLPCVISDGGDIGRDLVRAGLAEAVPLGDPEAVAVAIEDWIDRKGRLSEREHDLQRLSGRHEWSTATEPLAAAIEGSVGCGRPPLFRLLREVIAFYLVRVGWRLRGSVADRTSGLRVRAHRQNASRT